MTLETQLTKIEIYKALVDFIEFILPRFTKDKLLIISLQFHVDVYTNKEQHEYVNIKLIIYRPQNYTFVGAFTGDELTADTDIEFITYHDSAWRDGLDRKIRAVANSLASKINDPDNAHVFTTFDTFFPIKMVDGTILMDDSSQKRTAKYANR